MCIYNETSTCLWSYCFAVLGIKKSLKHNYWCVGINWKVFQAGSFCMFSAFSFCKLITGCCNTTGRSQIFIGLDFWPFVLCRYLLEKKTWNCKKGSYDDGSSRQNKPCKTDYGMRVQVCTGVRKEEINISWTLCSNDRASLISKWRRDQLDATNSDLLVIGSISTCFRHLYAHHQEIRLR